MTATATRPPKTSPVVVAVYENATRAALARAALANAGIAAFLDNENVLHMDPLYDIAMGGHRVLVRESDATRAATVLREQRTAPTKVRCPQCGSGNAYEGLLGRRASLLSLLLLGFPFGRAKARWSCPDCKHTWRR